MRALLPVLFAVMLAPSAAATFPSTLVSYFPAEGAASDEVTGAPGIHVGSYDAGRCGQGFRLDGIDDQVDVEHRDAWGFGADPFTIDLWANFDQYEASQPPAMVGNALVGMNDGSGWLNKWIFHLAQGRVWWHINSPSMGPIFLDLGPWMPTPGAWHHLAIVREGSVYTAYADGTTVGIAIEANDVPNAAAPLSIGRSEGIGATDGTIDEVRIWNEPKGAAEIQDLMTTCGAAVAPVPELPTLALAGLGIVVVGALALRHRKQ